MFSRVFPAYHPRAGEPTNFVEKILNTQSESTSIYSLHDLNPNKPRETEEFWKSVRINYPLLGCKYHTIRAGHRFKVGDTFTPRVWGSDINPKSGRSGPYHSKQIIIADDLEVKQIYNFELRKSDLNFHLNGKLLKIDQLKDIAKNDGLTLDDFDEWFNSPDFDGQIICWSDNIQY